MRPLENKLAVIAFFLVAGALAPWPYRLECALAAIVIVLLLAVFRMISHAKATTRTRTSNVYSQVNRIREARKERHGRK